MFNSIFDVEPFIKLNLVSFFKMLLNSWNIYLVAAPLLSVLPFRYTGKLKPTLQFFSISSMIVYAIMMCISLIYPDETIKTIDPSITGLVDSTIQDYKTLEMLAVTWAFFHQDNADSFVINMARLAAQHIFPTLPLIPVWTDVFLSMDEINGQLRMKKDSWAIRAMVIVLLLSYPQWWASFKLGVDIESLSGLYYAFSGSYYNLHVLLTIFLGSLFLVPVADSLNYHIIIKLIVVLITIVHVSSGVVIILALINYRHSY